MPGMVRVDNDLRIAGLLSSALAALMIVQPIPGQAFVDQYRDPEPIRTAWFGNDWITLGIGVPLLIGGRAAWRRGSARGLLVWLGLLGYAIYNYGFYLFGAASNAFFPLYVLALVIAVVALILARSALEIGAMAGSFGDPTPVRLVGGTLAGIGIVLAVVWLAIWGAHVFAGRSTPIAPEAFKVVAAMDLALMVPALTAGGVLLWRRRPWGYVIAAIASIQGALYLLVLSVNTVVAIRRGLTGAPGELPIWGPLLAITAAKAVILLKRVRQRS
jgi:hypothetical protein